MYFHASTILAVTAPERRSSTTGPFIDSIPLRTPTSYDGMGYWATGRGWIEGPGPGWPRVPALGGWRRPRCFVPGTSAAPVRRDLPPRNRRRWVGGGPIDEGLICKKMQCTLHIGAAGDSRRVRSMVDRTLGS